MNQKKIKVLKVKEITLKSVTQKLKQKYRPHLNLGSSENRFNYCSPVRA